MSLKPALGTNNYNKGHWQTIQQFKDHETFRTIVSLLPSIVKIGSQMPPIRSMEITSKHFKTGGRRILSKPVDKKEPVTVEILKKLIDKFGDESNLFNLRICVICLLGFSGFLRYDELSNIKMKDISFEQGYIELFIRKSKTDVYRRDRINALGNIDLNCNNIYNKGHWQTIQQFKDHETFRTIVSLLPSIVKIGSQMPPIRSMEITSKHFKTAVSTLALFFGSLIQQRVSVPVLESYFYCVSGRRILSKPVDKKEPVTVEILKKIGDESNLFNLRICIICLLGFSGFLRYDELSNIKMKDISFEQGYIELFIRKSKTDVYRRETQRKRIIEELVSVASKKDHVPSSSFRSEGNKIQFEFNRDRINALGNIDLNCNNIYNKGHWQTIQQFKDHETFRTIVSLLPSIVKIGSQMPPIRSMEITSKHFKTGGRRILSKPVDKKEPVTVEILKKLINKFGDESNLFNLRICIICLLGFSGFLRYDELSNIKMKDISFEQGYIELFIRKSKTDVYRRAVAIFNETLKNALETQRKRIIEELVSVASKKDHVPSSSFRSEDRINALGNIDLNCNVGNTSEASKLISSEIDNLNQRNKLLRIADKYGLDIAREYSDDPITENGEDAAKLRNAINSSGGHWQTIQQFKDHETFRTIVSLLPSIVKIGSQMPPIRSMEITSKHFKTGGRRILSKPVDKKEPVTVEILKKLINKFGDESNLFNLRICIICLLGFSGFLRYDELSNIKMKDISFEQGYIELFIRKSKTDVYRRAVAIFNETLKNALETQRKRIIEELVSVASKKDHVPSSSFRSEGNKIQFEFNRDRINALGNIDLNCNVGNTSEASKLISSEIDNLNQRNKLLRIADKYGLDIAREYSDDPITENGEDAAKLRNAINSSGVKRNSNRFQPYFKGNKKSTGLGYFDSFSSNQLFRGYQAPKDTSQETASIQDNFRQERHQRSQVQQQLTDQPTLAVNSEVEYNFEHSGIILLKAEIKDKSYEINPNNIYNKGHWQTIQQFKDHETFRTIVSLLPSIVKIGSQMPPIRSMEITSKHFKTVGIIEYPQIRIRVMINFYLFILEGGRRILSFLRYDELSNIKMKDISFEQGYIELFIRKSKTDEE
ncbi:hypothetical protein KUTeg_017372, partial [Tegillarca granosa]